MALGSENRVPNNQQDLYRGCYQKQQPRPLAPAPYKKPTNAFYLGTTLDSNNPAVVRRNARERNRVKQVNNGFTNLRQHIPTAIIADLSNGRRGIGPGAHKKLSKVDTLRMAVEYIRRLKDVIEEVDSASDTSSVSSYAASTSSSPPPTVNNDMSYNFYQPQAQYQNYSYNTAGYNFQPQQQHLISPTGSAASYNSNLSSNSETEQMVASLPLKFEQTIEDYSNTSADDEELLDYISLWQDEL